MKTSETLCPRVRSAVPALLFQAMRSDLVSRRMLAAALEAGLEELETNWLAVTAPMALPKVATPNLSTLKPTVPSGLST